MPEFDGNKLSAIHRTYHDEGRGTLPFLLYTARPPFDEPAGGKPLMPGSFDGKYRASQTNSKSSVSIHAPSFTRTRRNASPVRTSPSPSISRTCPLRESQCSLVNVRGMRFAERPRRSASAGNTSSAFGALIPEYVHSMNSFQGFPCRSCAPAHSKSSSGFHYLFKCGLCATVLGGSENCGCSNRQFG